MGDYEYLKYEPHSFGTCKEQNFTAKVKSSIWKEEEQRVTILGRKEGNEYKIYIPKILGACKVNEVADCSIDIKNRTKEDVENYLLLKICESIHFVDETMKNEFEEY